MPNPPDRRDLEIAALRERLSRLGQASLRITQDLDFNSVLQGALDSARSLTNARYGVIVLHDGDGVAEEFLASGMTPEETERLWTAPGWAPALPVPGPASRSPAGARPDRPPALPGPARPATPGGGERDRSPSWPFRCRTRGSGWAVSTWPRSRTEPEFSQEDEDTLALFAAQAALAIANARQHREERRDPGRPGDPGGHLSRWAWWSSTPPRESPVSFNREALRIVDGLREPDQSPVDLLGVVTLRRADGREVSLARVPHVRCCSAPGRRCGPRRSVLRVPGGSAASAALLNVTPIISERTARWSPSVVAVMQDLTPLEEAERLRADFLATVSHELLAPLTSIKGSAATLLGSATDLEPSLARQFFRIIEDQADHMKELVSDLLDVARIETGALPVSPEPAEVSRLVDRARSAFGSGGGQQSPGDGR